MDSVLREDISRRAGNAMGDGGTEDQDRRVTAVSTADKKEWVVFDGRRMWVNCGACQDRESPEAVAAIKRMYNKEARKNRTTVMAARESTYFTCSVCKERMRTITPLTRRRTTQSELDGFFGTSGLSSKDDTAL